jgi:hypothetical protein
LRKRICWNRLASISPLSSASFGVTQSENLTILTSLLLGSRRGKLDTSRPSAALRPSPETPLRGSAAFWRASARGSAGRQRLGLRGSSRPPVGWSTRLPVWRRRRAARGATSLRPARHHGCQTASRPTSIRTAAGIEQEKGRPFSSRGRRLPWPASVSVYACLSTQRYKIRRAASFQQEDRKLGDISYLRSMPKRAFEPCVPTSVPTGCMRSSTTATA